MYNGTNNLMRLKWNLASCVAILFLQSACFLTYYYESSSWKMKSTLILAIVYEVSNT